MIPKLLPAFFPMLIMDPDMPDTQDDTGSYQYQIDGIRSQKNYSPTRPQKYYNV